jgi:hypothetical protein
MSQRRTTVPPTHESSRVVTSRTVRADCKEKTEKQSAKRRTVLDNRFHRTDGPGLTGADPHAEKYSAREVATSGPASGAAWSWVAPPQRL